MTYQEIVDLIQKYKDAIAALNSAGALTKEDADKKDKAIKWYTEKIKVLEKQGTAVLIYDEYQILIKNPKRSASEDMRLDELKGWLQQPDIKAILPTVGIDFDPAKDVLDSKKPPKVPTSTSLTPEQIARLKADLAAQGYDPSMVPYVQKVMEAILGEPDASFETAYVAAISQLKDAGVLLPTKKDTTKPPIKMTDKDIAWITPKLQEMKYSPNEIELVTQLIKDAMQSGEPLATSFVFATNAYKPSGLPDQKDFIGFQGGSSWIRNPKSGEWEFKPPPEIEKEHPPLLGMDGSSHVWDPKLKRYIYTPPYISDEDKAKGKFTLGATGAYWEWDAKTKTPIYHAAPKADPSESDSYFSDGSSWVWNPKTNKKEYIPGLPVPLSPFQTAQIKAWDDDRKQQQAQSDAALKAAERGDWLTYALKMGEMSQGAQRNIQDWLTGQEGLRIEQQKDVQDWLINKEKLALEREGMIAGMTPRDWLKKTMLMTGGEPNPSEVDWLELLGVDMGQAQSLYEADAPARQAQAAWEAAKTSGETSYLQQQADYMAAVKSDETAYAQQVADYINQLQAVNQYALRVPGWLGTMITNAAGQTYPMVPAGTNIPRPNIPTPPLPPAARQAPAPYVPGTRPVSQNRSSWINQMPIQMAGAETYLNRMTPEIQQQALGLWETKGENVSGYDRIPGGGMPASWTGILRGGLRTAPKVHR